MAYIHGGGFTYSSGSEYHPGVLAAFNDVIVVTFNYRLGIFGFFNVPGTELKGNYGMLDQVRPTANTCKSCRRCRTREPRVAEKVTVVLRRTTHGSHVG